MTRIVVLGGGFAGAYCARDLERRLGRDVSITLIDRNNYLLFYPLLVEAGTGSLEPRHTVVSLRRMLRKTELLLGTVTGIDLDARVVKYEGEHGHKSHDVPYDHVVMALGSITRLPHVEGLHEHGFELKSLADAVALRDRAIRMLEYASARTDPEERAAALHFVIVGASFTGTELAGEFHAYLQKAAREYPGIKGRNCRVTLVERAERMLPALDESLAEYARRKLSKRGVEIVTGRTVESVDATSVTLDDGSVLGAHTTVWCAGVAPPPVVHDMDLPTDEAGWIRCEPSLRMEGRTREWAIGDCALNPDGHGRHYPATAQHALREGRWLARNIQRVLRGREPKPCRISSFGWIAPLGCRNAVAKVFGIKLSGFAAWWLFRSVYLMKMPGLARKLRIAFDWTMDLLLPADVVQLDIARGATRRGH